MVSLVSVAGHRWGAVAGRVGLACSLPAFHRVAGDITCVALFKIAGLAAEAGAEKTRLEELPKHGITNV